MKQVAISEFKAKCLSLLDEVQKTKQPILVTRRGKPVAEVSAPKLTQDCDWIGSMKDDFDIIGDIVGPASDPEDWEVLRD
jgi:prevent-host-death family protein